MMRFSTNEKTFLKAWDKLDGRIERLLSKSVKEISKLAVEVARDTKTFNNVNKEHTQFVMNGTLEADVFDDRPYAYYLEFGNDPGGGRIYPVTAKALHFFINGEEIFAKSVKAHGPYNFLLNGQQVASHEVNKIVEKNWKQEFR